MISSLTPLAEQTHSKGQMLQAPSDIFQPMRLVGHGNAPFQQALQALDLAPTEVWHVGDSPEDEAGARAAGLRLAPCYGSTETGAMVAALPPERFLAGESGCGQPLPHVELRLAADGTALQIRSSTLAAGFLGDGAFTPLPLQQGWWSSGDAASLGPAGLQVLGRLDGAISSGGETVFPEQVRERLLELSAAAGLPVQELLLLAQPDPLWGERLVALVRLNPAAPDHTLERLEALAPDLPPSQRPRRWLACTELAPTALGKWERGRWSAWAVSPRAAESPP